MTVVRIVGPVRCVLFDLDGTLYDERSGMRRALEATLAAAREAVPGLDVRRAAELYPLIGRPLWKTADTSAGGPSDSDGLRRRVFAALLDEMGAGDEELAGRLARKYARARRDGHRLFAETRDVIDRLAGRVPLGIVSNGASDLQREKLDRCGLAGRFDPVVISAEEGRMKPDGELFAVALSRCGCGPSETVFVGDSPEDDVAGAIGAGMTAVWINRDERVYPSTLPAPHAVLDDLTPLPGLLLATGPSGTEEG